MEKYELVLVLPGNPEKSRRSSLEANLKKILTTTKTGLLGKQDWGVKKMAYPIKKSDMGLYWFWQIEIEKTKIKELRRLLNFETDLLRYLLLKI